MVPQILRWELTEVMMVMANDDDGEWKICSEAKGQKLRRMWNWGSGLKFQIAGP